MMNLQRSQGVASACVALMLLAGPVVTGSAEASTLYALVDTGEIFASTDGGATWPVQSALPASDAAGLIAASSTSDLFLASRSGTVYRSQDAAVTWSAVGAIPASDVVDLAGRTDGALLALTRSGTLWISTDDGVTFSAQASLPASDLVSLARDASGNLFALTATGTVRRSTDGGTSWTTVGLLPVSDAVTVRAANGACFTLTDAGLTYRSLDQGVTWIAVGTVSQVGMTGLTPLGDDLVAVSREGLVARSADGTAWSWVGAVNQLHVVALADDRPQTVDVPETPGVALRLLLAPPRPNPLRSGNVVTLEFSLPENDFVTVELLDVQGRRVASRPPESFPASHAIAVRWNAGNFPSGVYFVRLSGRSLGRSSRRLVIVD